MSRAVKYPSLYKVLAEVQFSTEFELTPEVEAFIAEYDLDNQIEGSGEYRKLKKSVAESLHQITLAVSDLRVRDNSKKYIEDAVAQDVQQSLQAKYPNDNFNVQANISTAEVGADLTMSVKVSVQKMDDFLYEADIPSLYYVSTYGDALPMYAKDSPDSYWAAWLGIQESPFYDTAFVDSYEKDQAILALEQMYNVKDETTYADDVEQIVSQAADYMQVPAEAALDTSGVDATEKSKFKTTLENFLNKKLGAEEYDLADHEAGFMLGLGDIVAPDMAGGQDSYETFKDELGDFFWDLKSKNTYKTIYPHWWSTNVDNKLLVSLKEDAEEELPEFIEASGEEEIYLFRVDHDERGEFRAAVEGPDGEDVYNIKSDENGEVSEIVDGFMKHATDIAGLEKYLKQMDIIPAGAELRKA